MKKKYYFRLKNILSKLLIIYFLFLINSSYATDITINTADTTTQQDLDGDDTITVTASGSLRKSGNDTHAIKAVGSNNAITVEVHTGTAASGKAISTFNQRSYGINLQDDNNTIIVNGDIHAGGTSAQAIREAGGSPNGNSITVNSTATISTSGTRGIPFYSTGATDGTYVVNGTIQGNVNVSYLVMAIFDTDNATVTIGSTGDVNGGSSDRGFHLKGSGSVTNNGILRGTNGFAYAQQSSGDDVEIVNYGTITGSTRDIHIISGSVTSLKNSQGGNDTLTYQGALPTDYYAKISSSSDFGKITFNSESGSLDFALDSTSSITKTTYASVLQAISASSIGNEATWINFNSTYKYKLVANGSNWDVQVENRRTGYKARITKAKFSQIANIFESLNTQGKKSTLTSNLDALSDTALEKAFKQIKGLTVQKSLGQSVRSNNSFKRAVSSALSGPSVNSLTKNNYASLSLNDLNLQSDQGGYQVHSFNDFDFKSMANIFKNKDLFSLKSKDSTFFIRTFADQSNQDVVDGDAGYEALTAGFLMGNENNLSDEIQQGWALGLSTSDTDFDDNFGNSDSKTLHAMIYQNQQYDNFNLGLNIGTYVTRADMDRNITEGSIQTLNSKTYDYGFDVTADIKQSYTLKNDFIFTPSFSTNISYILQDDVDESGGDLALSVKNDNLLIVKPEIGFAIDKNFKNTNTVSQNFGFSVYGSYEDKLEGTTSKAKIKDTGSNFDIVDDNTDDTFITAGLGFTSTDKEKNQEYNFGIYHTQNDDNDLNSTLLSYNFKQKF